MSMKLSKIFQMAARRIKSGKNSMICIAIEECRLSGKDKDRACAIIADRLDGHASYVSWVLDRHPNLFIGTTIFEQDAIARDGRIRWCESLAAEFEAQGD
jgi:hypothetical protein